MLFFKRQSNNFFAKIWWQTDKTLLACFSMLLLIGIILVSTTSMFVALRIGVDSLYFIKNHFAYLILCLVIIFILSATDKKQMLSIAITGIVISFILLVYIVFFGQEIKGAKRWVYLMGVSIQPSEFIKVCFPVGFAFILSKLKSKGKDNMFVYLMLCIFYTFIVTTLLLQPDVGMTLLISGTFVTLLILSGLSFFWVIILAACGVLILLFSYFIFSHVHYRVNSFLFDQSTYQVNKSLSAIKTGALFGRGAGQGLVKEYLPDSHTDFIFTVGIEEFGLFFGIFIISIFATIFYRGFQIVSKETDVFKYLSIAGLITVITLQAIIHIFSNINLIPTKGMTLPLISYGGSSLLSMSIAVGFLLSLTKKNKSNIKIYKKQNNLKTNEE
jgi:cell division protein FtsW